MDSTSGESSDECDTQDSSAHEDKFFVSIRLRPLNEKEHARNDASVWECSNKSTIIFKNNIQDRSMLPTVYTFDRVFGPECPTRQVYDEGTKTIALSVLSGINSSIFAYGQTSSGKTHTMSGITQYAVADIYDYINNHPEREFVLKFSALEIYNELVHDLLSGDGTPLRLLDDPVRGTVVEKLTEVEIKDFSHLTELLSFCQAQRTIGETALNEMSSRSHQILCLTIESEPKSNTDNEGTLTASVTFVDLAGSERSSQTATAGTRLKEGSHINRSLLTLGTVIRKLSKGSNGHIPYRDSKLTRILQNSLGGNARTAIICTLSPAHSHVEQSKSTLVFANCARNISTHAQVNVVTSGKALIQQLRREIARLESEVRTLSSLAATSDTASTQKETEIIEKLNNEIRQLTHQQMVHSHGEDSLPPRGPSHASKSMVGLHSRSTSSWTDECSASEEASETNNPLHFNVSHRRAHLSERVGGASFSRIEYYFMNEDEQFLSDGTTPRLYIDKYFGPQSPDPGCWDYITQEAGNEFDSIPQEGQCIEFDFTKTGTVASPKLNQNVDENSCHADPLVECLKDEDCGLASSTHKEDGNSCDADPLVEWFKYEDRGLASSTHKEYESSCDADPLVELLNDEDCGFASSTHKEDKEDGNSCDTDPLVECLKDEHCGLTFSTYQEDENSGSSCHSSDEDVSGPTVTVNASCTESCSDVAKENEEALPSKAENQGKLLNVDPMSNRENQETENSCSLIGTNVENEEEEHVKTLNKSFKMKQREPGMKELQNWIMRNLANQFEDDLMTKHASPGHEIVVDDSRTSRKPEKDDGNLDKDQDELSAAERCAKFEQQKKEIIKLWAACNAPLVYRTYFFILFQGDASDTVYIDVELRRLSFLKKKLQGNRAIKDDQFLMEATSVKALNREREMLSRQMKKRFSRKERKSLYQKWGINLKTKQRRLQLCRKLWTDSTNMEHVRESAAIIAKLVGFKDPGEALKEMIGLSFLQKPDGPKGSSWRRRRHSLPSISIL